MVLIERGARCIVGGCDSLMKKIVIMYLSFSGSVTLVKTVGQLFALLLSFGGGGINEQDLARDGYVPYICKGLPVNLNRTTLQDPAKSKLIFSKLEKYLQRGYLIMENPANLCNYIDYFAAPKGDNDIRVVFNGTSCGLNHATWCSRFWLPMSNTMTRLLSFSYKVVDIDLGKMFLNFPIHDSLQKVPETENREAGVKKMNAQQLKK